MARVIASSMIGPALPMAVHDRVQDSWGNCIVRKKTIGLDGFLKQQKQTGGSDTAAEQEAQSLPNCSQEEAGPKRAGQS